MSGIGPTAPAPNAGAGLTIAPGTSEAAVITPSEDPPAIIARPRPIKMQPVAHHVTFESAEPKTKGIAAADMAASAFEDELDGHGGWIRKLDKFTLVDPIE